MAAPEAPTWSRVLTRGYCLLGLDGMPVVMLLWLLKLPLHASFVHCTWMSLLFGNEYTLSLSSLFAAPGTLLSMKIMPRNLTLFYILPGKLAQAGQLGHAFRLLQGELRFNGNMRLVFMAAQDALRLASKGATYLQLSLTSHSGPPNVALCCFACYS